MTQAHLTLKSSNSKTGPIPVSTTSNRTCPPTCPFNNGGGCYAELGPGKLHWDKVSNHERGTDWSTFCDQVTNLPQGTLWRHNQAGDLPGNGVRISESEMSQLITANKDKRGFTFTHYPMDDWNRAQIHSANRNGFAVNLSGNNPRHADDLYDEALGPVVTVLPSSFERQKSESLKDYKLRMKELPLTTPKGRRISICPATYKDDVICQSCGACANIERNTIIGFPSHGARKRVVDKVAA